MKVLHLLSSTGYHGAENMAAELVRRLSELGVRNYLGVLYGQKKSNKEILDTVGPCTEGRTVFPCSGRMDIRTVFSLRKYVKENGIEIIHSHKYKTNLYSALAALGAGTKLVSTCHNWLGESIKMRMYAKLDKNILRLFDVSVGVSDEVVEELKRYVAHGRIKKIENGVDLKRYRQVLEKNSAKEALGLKGKMVVGYVGRLSSDKGISYLFKAVKKLSSDGIDVHALIVGDGDFAEPLKAEALSIGISDRVVFTGKRDDTPEMYSAMDVFALPSMKEAFPMVVLEAMACGLPVMATRVGDVPKIIEDNISGFIVEPRDDDKLCSAIKTLLTDPQKADSVGKAAAISVRNKYSSLEMAKRYAKIYEEVLSVSK